MEAIKAVIFNSPTKKTNTIYNHPSVSSRPSQSKAKVGQKQTSNNIRNNNLVGNQKKIHVEGPGLDRIKIIGSGQIRQTQRPPSNLRSPGPGQIHEGLRPSFRQSSQSSGLIHPGLRPSINPSSRRPSTVHQGLRQYVNQGSPSPAQIHQGSRQYVNQRAPGPTQFHQGSNQYVNQTSSSPTQIHQSLRAPVIQGSKPVTNLGLDQIHPGSRHPVRLGSPSQNFVKVLTHPVPDEDIIHSDNSNMVKKKSLKRVVVPALYSLKELALKKKKMRESMENHSNNGIKYKVEENIKSESKSLNLTKEKHLLETNAPFRDSEVNKLVTNKEWIQTVEDDDSDIEVEEINVISKSAQPIIAPSESGNNFVISTILKQVEDLENTLKNNVAKKDSELQVEKQIVEQLKKKNQILELRDKKRKEAMEEKDNEVIKEAEKKNKEIETLQLTMKSFSDSMAQKLTQKQNEIDTLQSVSRKNSDFMSRKVTQKQDELTALGKLYEKVSSELEDLQKWRSTQVFKEKEALTKLIQGSLGKDKIYKQRIEALEKNISIKDDLIAEHEKSIESLNVKICERDGLVRNLKLKVNALVTEFSNGFKDKDEQLNTKIEEINENSKEIERLKRTILGLEKNISDKVKEIDNKELLNKKQAAINGDLLKKLSIAEHWMSLHSVKQQEAEDIIESLEKINADYVLATKQLQKKLSKLKTIKANGLAIQNEDIFEDKVEQFMYNFYGKEKMNKQLMLTYSWPVFGIHVDPCLLQEVKEHSKGKTISQINIEGKPRMLTYLWPVLPFQQGMYHYNISCKGDKRKISIIPSDCSIIPVSLLKTVEQVRIIDDIVEFLDSSFDKKETVATGINHNWPIIPFNEVINRKRKFEELIENLAKRSRLSTDSFDIPVINPILHIKAVEQDRVLDCIANGFNKKNFQNTGINHIWPIVPFNEVIKSKRKFEELIENVGKLSQSSLSADIFNISVNPVPLLKTIEQVRILDDVADFIDNNLITKESDASRISHNWPIVAFNEGINSKRKFEDLIITEVKRIKLDTELKSCEDVLMELVSSILDDIVEYAGKHAIYLTSDIITELVEKCETVTKKDWPMMRCIPNAFMKGVINVDLKKCIKSKGDIKFCKGDLSRQEIVQLFHSFQVRPPLFELPKEISFVNKVELKKCLEIIDKTWPVMIYQENGILQNIINLRAALDHKNVDTDETDVSSIELNLKETRWECKKTKRKFEEGLDLVCSKRTRLCDRRESLEYHTKSVEANIESVEEKSENVVQIIYETIDYVVSFAEIKRLLM